MVQNTHYLQLQFENLSICHQRNVIIFSITPQTAITSVTITTYIYDSSLIKE